MPMLPPPSFRRFHAADDDAIFSAAAYADFAGYVDVFDRRAVAAPRCFICRHARRTPLCLLLVAMPLR